LLLQQAMQQTGQSFKATLNEALRRGLADVVPQVDEKPFVVKAKNMGPLRPGIDPTKLGQFADQLEVEAHLEVTRKLEQRLAKKKKKS
jgi:capsid protein